MATNVDNNLKKLLVYVNFTGEQINLDSLKQQLVASSKEKYPDRVFFVANDGTIISHGVEFGTSEGIKKRIETLETKATNLETTTKALTGLKDVTADVSKVSISDDSVIGKYVAEQILKNKTIVTAKENSGITVEEAADKKGTTTYTIGLDQEAIVDGKSIITTDGKLGTNVELVLTHEKGTHGDKSPYLVLQTKAVTGNTDENKNHASEVISKFDVSEFVTDGMLDTVEYDEAEGTLTFTWNADGKKNSTSIDIKKLFNIEGIHTGTKDYLTVKFENPIEHPNEGDVTPADKVGYHIDAKVDGNDLTAFSTITHTPASDGVDESYSTNLPNDSDVTLALANVSGLVDAKKVATKIAAIDKAIVGVGNDALAREKTLVAGVDKKIADLQQSLEAEVARATAAEQANAAAIETLNGDENTKGSVDAKIKALRESLDSEVKYADANKLVQVSVSEVDGKIVEKENAVEVKTDRLTVNTDQDAEYTLANASGFTAAGKYKAKGVEEVAAKDPALVTTQDAWIYGQCIKAQAIKEIASDNNEYIKIVREDNTTKIAFEPWVEIHTIEELNKVGGETTTKA